MCGIMGYASCDNNINKSKLRNQSDFLYHRGPDNSNIWESKNGKVGFAHQRLSIIDLSSGGNQPMTDVSSRYTITFNGEIYNYQELAKKLSGNYKFKSSSDTEVILAAYSKWGADCVLYLDGMFAFAIYDSVKNLIFMSRDRAGEKPLYYRHSNKVLSFASELKVFLNDDEIDSEINKESLDCYLSMGYVPKDRCIIEGFNKLPAAHSILFDMKEDKLNISKYWDIPKINHSLNNENCAKELEIELEDLLESSINQQMIADVPVGVLLSGGVDSSLITAIASRNSSNLKAFTVRFPNSGKFDETEHARLIANTFNTEHVELDASNVDPEILYILARQFDEPIVDSSIIPTFLVSQLVQKHCKVVLSGDGADELFGGYDHYSRLLKLEQYSKLTPRLLRSSISFLAENLLPVGVRGRNWAIGCDYSIKKEVPMIANYFDQKNRKNLLLSSFGEWDVVAEEIFRDNVCSDGDIIQRATRTDFNNFLVEDILVKVDRASMLNSLEVRAPFLDRKLVEFAFGAVPTNMKTSAYNSKILLKNLAKKILPKDFNQHRKQGFSIPIDKWLREDKFKDFFHDILLDPNCLFDKKIVSSLLKAQDNGRNIGERLFALVMFELWRREYKISF